MNKPRKQKRVKRDARPQPDMLKIEGGWKNAVKKCLPKEEARSLPAGKEPANQSARERFAFSKKFHASEMPAFVPAPSWFSD